MRGRSHGPTLFVVGFALLLVNSAYLAAFSDATLFYFVNVAVHGPLGLALAAAVSIDLARRKPRLSAVASIAGAVLIVAAATGLIVMVRGATTPHRWLVRTHVVFSVGGAAFLLFALFTAARRSESARVRRRAMLYPLTGCALVAAALGGSNVAERQRQQQFRIQNPATPPLSMAGEGAGPNGPFFPSSADTTRGGIIPADFFTTSAACGRCHTDIYNQWKSSVHHFSSFNNQWYRKSIEYMQDVVGTKPSKWCGGCHDPAVLYGGLMDTPIKQIVNRPEAQAGLGCVMCHSIAKVKSTMGQGDFVLEYPELHDLAASKNPLVRALHDFTIKLNPEPHRRVFLKPFMRTQTAEFCSTCHKVHLDVPVNHYRWIRGFNEYDNWQASGVSGEGARSFYYPPKPSQCADCHMPLAPSHDAGNIDGFVHSHRFPAANTAVPTANEDAAQLKITEEFLKNGQLSVDIFALSPAQAPLKPGAVSQSDLSTTFAVGEEAETKVAGGSAGEAAPITAPLNRVQPPLRRGDTVRVDVV